MSVQGQLIKFYAGTVMGFRKEKSKTFVKLKISFILKFSFIFILVTTVVCSSSGEMQAAASLVMGNFVVIQTQTMAGFDHSWDMLTYCNMCMTTVLTVISICCFSCKSEFMWKVGAAVSYNDLFHLDCCMSISKS